MALSQQTTTVAVLASLAVGVVVTLTSGELRADRDVGLELLRANEALGEQVARQELELAELRARIEAGAGKPGGNGTTGPGTAPKSKAESDAAEQAEFRKKVLAVMKPEIDAVDARATAAKATFDKHVTAYANHSHDVDMAAHGWVRLDTMLTEDGVDSLRPSYSDDWIAIRRADNGVIPGNGLLTKTTTKPK
ncbi:MAG: hypothetical protein IAG13_29230 [Deltaproteobacteria bacterium]|nr:hypothetical protein [Nannocystaceae bacterium]